jgi:molybdate/tungstate transport system substrate-binding protein
LVAPRQFRPAAALAGVAALSLTAGAFAFSVGASAHTTPVNVVYAGSLATINDQILAPAFTKATGIAYEGEGNATLALAQEIVSGEVTADLFESVGTSGLTAVGTKLMPWAVSVASQPLVVMYNPKSRFASAFRAIADGRKPLRDLFPLLATPGLKLGRTDPETDPQGQAFVLMVHLAQKLYHLPQDMPTKILGALENPNEVFTETGLPAEIQSGAIDASSGFLPQAIELKLPYIALPASLDFAAAAAAKTYAEVSLTLPDTHQTVVGAPLAILAGPLFEPGSHTALGVRYLEFVMSAKGQALLKANGFTPVALPVYGNKRLLPAQLRREVAQDAK